MGRIRSRNTRPELALRKKMRECGLAGKYRVHWGEWKADMAFPRDKILVFYDDCFWHMCPLHCRLPRTNILYWWPKLIRNRLRDRRKTREMKRAGWAVVRIRGHDLRRVLNMGKDEFLNLLKL